MPKKKSVRKCAQQFRREADELLEFCRESEALSDSHQRLVYDMAIIKLYAAFEKMIAGALTGAINNDTSVLSSTTSVNFPDHLTDEVCEYIITGGGYFDFRGRDGLIREIKRYVPDEHYLATEVKDGAYKEPLDRLCALRNYAAHGSSASKTAALKAVGHKRIASAGAWLKTGNRFQKIVKSLSELSSRVEESAPY